MPYLHILLSVCFYTVFLMILKGNLVSVIDCWATITAVGEFYLSIAKEVYGCKNGAIR
jgi:hypothetical protein